MHGLEEPLQPLEAFFALDSEQIILVSLARSIRTIRRNALRLLAVAWAFPTTLLGLVFLALALLTGGRVKQVGGVLEAHGGMIATLLNRGPLAKARIAAVTLGHVVLAPDQAVLDECRVHERTHVRQCERWGPFFLPAYAASSLWAMLRGKDPYRENRFEREAFSDVRVAMVAERKLKSMAETKVEA